ncbi:GntR family transcriptional regulator [Methylobacterium sp. Leaf104]|uniref:GntR family transcriptional regulator n=1 Tax=Methylobacterium TaxID=407 RepID=UPI0006F330F1|nr:MULTISPECIES: GntR family transcriptional regulator [Methylobacterium]KQP29971.1 GntR family transcriptional regulator [Methylobacterium sp. Leaf104]MCI9882328.1 GntR family transcriptional regulator [Methylobacterium goesingense]
MRDEVRDDATRVESRDRVGSICRSLRRAIVERAIMPGDRLPEDALGERFGVSRTIARQALGQLAGEGLVELRRNRIAVVATPSWAEARDTFDVRISLERLVVARLAGRLTPEQQAALNAHIGQEEAVQGGADGASIRLATEFHLLLAQMTGSPVLERYVAELGYRCALVLSLYSRPHSAECGVSEHRALVAALIAGDPERAMALMDHHLDAVAERARIVAAPPRERDLGRLLAPYIEPVGA